ncbi:MAG: YesL family protein [Eubacteriales bacterium]|nr:YesL family protein [Eubacteriales bacterium]
MEKYSAFCDRFLLSCLFILTCLPVITIGPSIAALYYTITKVFYREEGYLGRSYFNSFRENLKQGIVLTLILLLYLAIGFAYLYLISGLTASGRLPLFMNYFKYVYFLPGLLGFPWMFIYMSRFNDTIRTILSNSIRLGMGKPGITLLADVVIAVITAMMWFLLPLLPFVLVPLAELIIKRTEPVLKELS